METVEGVSFSGYLSRLAGSSFVINQRTVSTVVFGGVVVSVAYTYASRNVVEFRVR